MSRFDVTVSITTKIPRRNRIDWGYQSILCVSSMARDELSASGDSWLGQGWPYAVSACAHRLAERDHDLLVTGALPSEL